MNRATARRATLAACLTVAAAASVGCRSMSDVVRAKESGEGVTRLHAIDCDAAYGLAIGVFRREGAEAIEEHRAERYMLTSSGMGLFTYGTLMGAWFEPEKTGKCAVTAVTKRKVSTDMVTTLGEATFHDRLAEAVQRETATKKPAAPAAPATPATPAATATPAASGDSGGAAAKAAPSTDATGKKAAKKSTKKTTRKTTVTAPKDPPAASKEAGAADAPRTRDAGAQK